MSEHTPGPYTIKGPSNVPGRPDESGDFAVLAEVGGKQVCIAEFFNMVEVETFAPAFQNARLFVAAPQLLEALTEIAGKKGFCIYGTDEMPDDPTEAFRLGSAIALNQLAAIASDALAKAKAEASR